MKKILLILGLLLFIPPEIFSDLEEKISYKQLSWSDFQAKPGSYPDDFAGEIEDFTAFTFANIESKWEFEKTNSGVCEYEFTVVEGIASFYPFKSWVRKNALTNQGLLKHEQGHFDIPEIHARAFENQLLGKKFSCPGGIFNIDKIDKVTNQALDEILDDMREMNLQYDFETSHDFDTKKQMDWNLKLECMLKNNGPTNYCLNLISKEEPKTQLVPTQPTPEPESVQETEPPVITIPFETFASFEYGFSIDYPTTWFVNDEIYEEDDGVGIVSFSPNQETGEPFFGVSILSDKERFSSPSGYQYVNQLVEEEKQSCTSLTILDDGFECSGFELIEADFFTDEGYYAYTVTFYYSTEDFDGNTEERIYFKTEVTIENQVWQFVYDSSVDDWELYSDLYAEMISSIDVFEFEETIQSVETTVEQEAEIENKPEPTSESGGGCLIATAAFGSELAPQVQQLREIRDNSLLQTNSGSAFMESFNQFYYSFSPGIADLERENPVFKEAVKLTITPLLSTLSLLNYVDMDSEAEALGYGISLILLNVGMYFVAPTIAIVKLRKII